MQTERGGRHGNRSRRRPAHTAGSNTTGGPGENAVENTSRRSRPTRHRHRPRGGRGGGRSQGQIDVPGNSAAELNSISNSDSRECRDGPSVNEQAEASATCAICCESLEIVAKGSCDHSQMCGVCCLRLRLCYGDQDCPFCKTTLSRVVIFKQYPDQPVPKFSEVLSKPQHLFKKDSWAEGVLVDKRRRYGGFPLHVYLQRQTGWSCKECDPKGDKPFPSHRQLNHHLRTAHGKNLCSVCQKANRQFPLEMETYNLGEELEDHEASHPSCEFCDVRFYDKDAMYMHMQRQHCTCHVCMRSGIQYQYFRNGAELLGHMRECHYTCEHADCHDSFVSFATEQELRDHVMYRHSNQMPRWTPGRTRQLPVNFLHRNLENVLTADGEPSGRRQRRRRNRGRTGAHRETAQQDSGNQNVGGSDRMGVRDVLEEGVIDTSSHFQMIDDNEPVDESHQREVHNLRGAWRERAQAHRPNNEEDFPALQSTAPANPPAPLTWRTVTVRCPCGRRSRRLVVEINKEPPKLKCDNECEEQRRRAQLADAFGIQNPDEYVPVADRASPKDIELPLEVIMWARDNSGMVSEFEMRMERFTVDKSEARLRIPIMPKEQRKFVHKLAELYGLVSRGVGGEGNRCVELLRTGTSCAPKQTLTSYAVALSEQQIQSMKDDEASQTLTITDISPQTDIHRYLGEWHGDYKLQWLDRKSVSVTFRTQAAFKAASYCLAGGIRGAFHVIHPDDRLTQHSASPKGSSNGPASSATQPGSSMSSTWVSIPARSRPSPAPVFKDAWDDDEDVDVVREVVGKKSEKKSEGGGLDSEGPSLRLGLENVWQVLVEND